MIDKPVDNDVSTVTPARNQINAKADNEKWEHHLEKAYFERQRQAMQAAEESITQTQLQSDQNSPAKLPQQDNDQGASQIATRVQGAEPGVQGSDRLHTAGSAAGSTPRSEQSRPIVALSGGAGRASESAKAALSPQQSAPAARSSIAVFRGVLPATSEVTALKSEIGINLVIRDVSLNVADVLQIIDKLRELALSGHERLGSVTLNGRRVWEADNQLGPTTSLPSDDRSERHLPKIDRKY